MRIYDWFYCKTKAPQKNIKKNSYFIWLSVRFSDWKCRMSKVVGGIQTVRLKGVDTILGFINNEYNAGNYETLRND